MTWALTMDFINYAGDEASVYIPMFNTEAECLWWKTYLWRTFEHLHGARSLISASCARIG